MYNEYNRLKRCPQAKLCFVVDDNKNGVAMVSTGIQKSVKQAECVLISLIEGHKNINANNNNVYAAPAAMAA